MNHKQQRQKMRQRHGRLKRRANRLRKQIERLDDCRSRVRQKLRSLRYQIQQIEVADAEWGSDEPGEEEERPPVLRGQLPMFEGAFPQRREA